MMGSPQPFNTLEQKHPSLQPSTRSAIKIQRVVLPCEKQFIRNLLCYTAGVCIAKEIACGFCIFYYIIFRFL